MVVASPNPVRNEKILAIDLPMIDLSADRSEVGKLIVRACEEYGFFKVINHGVPEGVIAEMEQESVNFFEKPLAEKQRAGPANPFGYGCKNIGFNGDMGEVEFLLLHTNPLSIAQRSKSISNDPSKFGFALLVQLDEFVNLGDGTSHSVGEKEEKRLIHFYRMSAMNNYIRAVRELACEILDLMAEGLWVRDPSYFSKMIRDVENDSFFRINHYPSCCNNNTTRVGFGEHSDPQILTILRSNDVGGLQISPDHGVWIPVAPDSAAFCVNVGDVLQAMTNGRFVSVRHRALSYSSQSRMSMAYFGAPALQARVSAPPEMVTTNRPSLYRPFTWAEYKATAYSLSLGDNRLDLFINCKDDDHKKLLD
ncbi:Gibberellin 2-beta-dioxygenase 4 [Citrus sinensis]|nr:Gibberellin 2-beta-dioxygenase 4 [Citrus sinensis]